MWYRPCSREDLLELFERDGSSDVAADTFEKFADLPYSRVRPIAYWKEDPRRGPSIPTGVVMPSDQIRDFIAWVATYISLRPFTAYCRIVDLETVEYFDEMREPTLGRLENCHLGIILAECAQNTATLESLKRLSPAECEGALSFALARSIALGPGQLLFDRIEAQWRKARLLIFPKC